MGDDGVKLGSLFEWAKQSGWVRPKPKRTTDERNGELTKGGQTQPPSRGPAPRASQERIHPTKAFANFLSVTHTGEDDGQTKVRKVPLGIQDFGARLEEITPGSPKVVNSTLFWESEE